MIIHNNHYAIIILVPLMPSPPKVHHRPTKHHHLQRPEAAAELHVALGGEAIGHSRIFGRSIPQANCNHAKRGANASKRQQLQGFFRLAFDGEPACHRDEAEGLEGTVALSPLPSCVDLSASSSVEQLRHRT